MYRSIPWSYEDELRGLPDPDGLVTWQDDLREGSAPFERNLIAELPTSCIARFYEWEKAGDSQIHRGVRREGGLKGLPRYLFRRYGMCANGPLVRSHLAKIFGSEYLPVVVEVIEAHYGAAYDREWIYRISLRIEAGCPTPADIRVIRMEADERITDAQALEMRPWGDETRYDDVQRRMVRSARSRTCDTLGIPIPCRERHVRITRRWIDLVDGPRTLTTRHSMASVWVDAVLEPDCARWLREAVTKSS